MSRERKAAGRFTDKYDPCQTKKLANEMDLSRKQERMLLEHVPAKAMISNLELGRHVSQEGGLAS